mmetsp:Transcript_14669/g.37342  ORF Transcript_14669/g.37342 Transcript_14669/m.37342 type:complete len:230 (-) Transcript_14669:733-1422(-)
MLGPQLSDDAHRLCAAVVGQGAGDDLQRLCHRAVRQVLHPLQRLGALVEVARERHFNSTAARHKTRVEHHVLSHAQRVLNVAVQLVQHILASAAQDDGARLGVLAVVKEGEVLIPNLFHLKQAAPRADVLLLDLVSAAHNGGAARLADARGVGLAESAEGSHAVLYKVVLRKIRQAFLRDDNVGLELEDVHTHLLDGVLLQLQQRAKVVRVHHLHICLALALLVLQRTV